MKNLYGQSGAKLLRVGPTLVFKHGNERVGAQGKWLLENKECSVLPTVKIAGSSWYLMQRLDNITEIPDELTVVNMLNEHVWNKNMSVPVLPLRHAEYIEKKLVTTGLKSSKGFEAKRKFIAKNFQRLGVARSHGDTTISNLMLNKKTGNYMMIDPVPGSIVSFSFPVARSVDMGKLLQSGIGYERRRFLRHTQWSVNGVVKALEKIGVPSFEIDAALYFCAAHLLAAIPYTPVEYRDTMAEMFYEASDL